MANVKELLIELIKIDSRNNTSNLTIIKFISEKLSKFEQKLIKYNKGNLELYNLIVKIPGKKSDSPLVFILHTDTICPSSNWSEDPFKPVIKSDYITGLGAADIKGSIAAILNATLLLKDKTPKDIYLIFDSDEEGSGLGSKQVIKDLNLKNCEVIVCEPMDNKIIVGQKACIGLDIVTKGISLHSSKTSYKNNQENNAINKAINIANKLIEKEKEFNNIKDPIYGYPTLNIGKIEGGNNGNSVADQCLMKVDIRLLPSQNPKIFLNELTSIIKKEDPKSGITIKFLGESFYTNPDSQLIKKIRNISKNIINFEIDTSSAWTEAAIFKKYGECVILGPGEINQAHKTDEKIAISEVEKYSLIFKKIMEVD